MYKYLGKNLTFVLIYGIIIKLEIGENYEYKNF